MVENLEKINTIMDRYKGEGSALISMLQDIQNEYNYLPEEALREVAQTLDIPLIDIYSVATFYKSFSLTPRGKHLVTVCLGTACHVRGGRRILGEIVKKLNIEPGETTEDKLFTLETVNCLGCCAIGPIVVVDGEYYGEMTVRKVESVLKNYEQANAPDNHPN
jgi:NADH-quinone oxidoreductase subunit E